MIRSMQFVTIWSALLVMGLVSPVEAIEVGGIGISPISQTENRSDNQNWFQFTLTPGTAIDDVVVISNNTAEEISITLYPADHTTSSSGGYAVEQATEERNEVGSWIQLSQSELTIAPHSSVEVPFTIQIPIYTTLPAGDYTGGIMMADTSVKETVAKGMVLSTRVGVRVYVTVPGQVVDDVHLVESRLERLSSNPSIIDVTAVISNSGTINQQVTLTTIVDMTTPWPQWLSRGQTLPYQKQSELEVLAGDTLEHHLAIEKPWFGQMHVQHHLTYTNGVTEVITDDSAGRLFIMPSLATAATMLAGLMILGWVGLVLARWRRNNVTTS